MQGTVCIPHNLQTGSPPPQDSDVSNVNLEATSKPNLPTKDFIPNQSNRSDSGVFSATMNSTYPGDPADTSAHSSTLSDSDNRSDCSSPDHKHFCPICKMTFSSQHDFTLHIRSHNNHGETQDNEKGFVCRICKKALSSSSSLDRHVLVHSGERPFACKYCGDTFTTNGNMHRHVRTHTNKNESYESDSSTDSGGSRNIEFNNNKVESKRKYEGDEDAVKLLKKGDSISSTDHAQNYKCPICDRTDFDSLHSFETHIEDNHPNSPVSCNQCNQMFQNNRLLNAHRSIVHNSDEATKHAKSFVTGFKDLTFVDFSSQKFPHIARYQCEKSIHKASSGLQFVCQKCSRAFPCAASLEIHEKECGVGLDLSIKDDSPKTSAFSESEIKRADFFGRLDLQNAFFEKHKEHQKFLDTPNKLHQHLLANAVKKIDSNKDLADIQSIISMTTNGSLLQQLNQKPEIKNVDIQECSKNDQEDESQDIFAAEFRKMKMRGEFPCRLCTAIFPNLRALKGHNRTHLNGTTNGTYYCNMCPHSSVDKAALVRHMRTHNGDRPYECSICNYAFTTKANCERHLRNRHSKSTREEVKKSIIYHPSEDPTNDEINKVSGREESKKVNFSFSSDNGDISPDKLRSSTPKMSLLTDIPKPVTESICIPKTISPQFGKETSASFPTLKEHHMNQLPYMQPQFVFNPALNSLSTPQSVTSKIQVRDLETLKKRLELERQEESAIIHQNANTYEDEQPLNLVLDLSKKKTEQEENTSKTDTDEDIPQDLSRKSAEKPNELSMGEILAQQLLKNTPKIDPHSFYATHLALYRNGLNLSNWPFPLNPLLFPSLHSPLVTHDPQELKERLQRLQLAGGGMIADTFSPERLQNFQNSFNGLKLPEVETPKFPLTKQEELTVNIDQTFNDGLNKIHSPLGQQKPDLVQSPNSVKMVIKNGVLMPKQKQRRYRTERPFSCEHCSARFTLRSNMERHIKQQHPQFWSQRQRSGVGNPGRKPQILPVSVKSNYCDLTIPTFEVPKLQGFEETKEHINDKLKYAILAHHLRNTQNFNSAFVNNTKKEEDEDCDLIIDEKDEVFSKTEEKAEETKESSSSTKILEERLKQLNAKFENKNPKHEEVQDLVPVSRLLDNASQQQFKEFFRRDGDDHDGEGISEEDEEGLVASGSTSEGNNSGTDENRSESEATTPVSLVKKKSAYSLAPNRVSCPYCSRKFPWTSSLRRHILTHTGQKPFKCSHCPLLFTTKSNCDRHLLRKHGNSATTINNDSSNNNNANYMMRNVPERPFKCSNCPSSTFSTYTNLKKHINCKHLTNAQGDDIKAQGYEAGSSEDEKVTNSDQKTDWDVQIMQNSNRSQNNEHQSNSTQNSDLPFKCHLCERSFAERQDALDHIKQQHASEYDLLMSKNALDMNATTPDDINNHEDDESETRGKFPDYSNRKVVCAFCMRRFWSAEDLRRHMRTHTGERPFSCDICRRRFTLKHSMLRHRKKHNVAFDTDNVNSDEDGNTINEKATKVENNNVSSKNLEKTDESDGNEGSDLISNLLGLRDKSILDQVLTASADDAAKLLGVKNGSQE